MLRADDSRIRGTLRLRIAAAATGAVLVAYAAVAALMLAEVVELNNDADSIQAAVSTLVVVSALADNEDLDAALDANLEPGGSVVIVEREEITFRSGPFADELAGIADGVDVDDVVQLDGNAHAWIVAPCAPSSLDDCTVRVAVPTDGFGNTLVDNLWIVLGLAAAALLITGSTVWWSVGRALRFLDALSTEVNEISDSRTPHRLSRPHGDDEVRRLVDTLNNMLERLHRARGHEQRFIADASHELRSPVAAISITTENVVLDPTRRSSDATWERLTTETIRLQRVVEQLLTLAATDQRTAILEPVDLASIVRSHATRLAATSTVHIETTVTGAPFAMSTAQHVDRVCSNLLSNAVRHATSRVDVLVSHATRVITLEVSDDGPGIPESRREDVFEAFTRLDAARTADAGGAGLGLAIARAAARDCGGDVTLRGANHFVCEFAAPDTTS
ncbi:MAG: ATP-binding protein [Ilumatobacter sp.]